jgi:hypothetical protein
MLAPAATATLLPVDQRQGLQRHRRLARLQARRALRQPLLHADPPDLHPRQRRLPVEADADVRVAAQRRPDLGAEEAATDRASQRDPRETSATTTSSASTRASATSARATSRRAAPRRSATKAAASADGERPRRLPRLPRRDQAPRQERIEERYGNLFEMYERITGENPYEVPMRIFPAPHYTMGGLWVDYDLSRRSPACSCSARPTSPITAPTASAHRR